jgi:hypothetical protein
MRNGLRYEVCVFGGTHESIAQTHERETGVIDVPEATEQARLNGVESLTRSIGGKAVEIEGPACGANEQLRMKDDVIRQGHFRSLDRVYPRSLQRP